jgi:octaprenyl-diphosphate synthase
MTLDTILEPIKTELNDFETHFEKMLVSEVGLIIDVLTHVNTNKGKRLRPIIMFLIAKIFDKNIKRQTYNNAAMIEILHTATLIHDDVVDNSQERRGEKSVNSKWNNKIAVLLGDFLFSRGMLPAFRNKDYDFLSILLQISETMSEGELFAIEHCNLIHYENFENWKEEDYYKIIFAKTASLISGACKASAMISTNNENEIEYFTKFGENIGMAFQIKDDIFDFTANSQTIGKPVGNDIREGKITIPLIFALNNSTKSEKAAIINLIKKADISDEDIDYIVNFTTKKAGIDYALEKANEFSQKAISCLDFLPNSIEKAALVNFAKFVVLRDK